MDDKDRNEYSGDESEFLSVILLGLERNKNILTTILAAIEYFG